MDCKTAQILLEFAGPRRDELAAEDAHALEEHLGLCPDCGPMAVAERRVDEHLGKAMRAVDVPDRLRNHLLAKLDAERADWYRQRIFRYLKPVAAAAACALLFVGAWAGWSLYRYYERPTPDIATFERQVLQDSVSPPERPALEKEFKGKGYVTVLPDFNYRYLKSRSIGEFQGVNVPQLVFHLDGDDTTRGEIAIVSVLSEKQFKLADVPSSDAASSGYPYKVAVQHQPGGSFAYVIVYTGKDYEWLKNKP
jgi:hypothetical protein